MSSITPYVDVHFTDFTECVIKGDNEALRILSGDQRCNVLLNLTEDRKDALRHIVRQWDLDDEAEARGEVPADAPRAGSVADGVAPSPVPDPAPGAYVEHVCKCGHPIETHDDTPESDHRCIVSLLSRGEITCGCTKWQRGVARGSEYVQR